MAAMLVPKVIPEARFCLLLRINWFLLSANLSHVCSCVFAKKLCTKSTGKARFEVWKLSTDIFL